MRYPKRIKKTGKPGSFRGARLTRKLKFQPVLDTAAGIPVRSKLERVCVDWLVANNIEFQYEPLILIESKQFRPDFYLPEHDTFLEICGYNHMPHYREKVRQKKYLYNKFKIRAIFIECKNKSDMEKALESELTKQGLLKADIQGE